MPLCLCLGTSLDHHRLWQRRANERPLSGAILPPLPPSLPSFSPWPRTSGKQEPFRHPRLGHGIYAVCYSIYAFVLYVAVRAVPVPTQVRERKKRKSLGCGRLFQPSFPAFRRASMGKSRRYTWGLAGSVPLSPNPSPLLQVTCMYIRPPFVSQVNICAFSAVCATGSWWEYLVDSEPQVPIEPFSHDAPPRSSFRIISRKQQVLSHRAQFLLLPCLGLSRWQVVRLSVPYIQRAKSSFIVVSISYIPA